MPIENARKMVVAEATSLDGYSPATTPTPNAIPVTDAEGTLPVGFIPAWADKEDVNNKGQADGYAGLDANGTVPLTQLPSSVKEAQVVADIAARDALEDVFAGLHVLVLDATDDETVETGGAEYVYTGSEFVKIAELDDLDMVLEWINIQDGPNSTPSEIDGAVDNSHTHENMTSLEFIGTDEEDMPTWNNEPWPSPASEQELPAIDEEEDGGKVLAVTSAGTAVEWMALPVVVIPDPELPEIEEGDKGKVLAVNTEETAVEWMALPASSFPEIEEGDKGKVLAVNEDEDAVEWTTLPVVEIPDPELPEIGEGDKGKVLSINEDEDAVEWMALPVVEIPDPELPEIEEGDMGKVLQVNSDESGVEWAVPFALPAFDEETDGGKVLAITADGSGLEWVTLPSPEEEEEEE